jgi:hypothetical protein
MTFLSDESRGNRAVQVEIILYFFHGGHPAQKEKTMTYEIHANGKHTGLTYSDREVARAIARDMEREGAKRVEVRPA